MALEQLTEEELERFELAFYNTQLGDGMMTEDKIIPIFTQLGIEPTQSRITVGWLARG